MKKIEVSGIFEIVEVGPRGFLIKEIFINELNKEVLKVIKEIHKNKLRESRFMSRKDGKIVYWDAYEPDDENKCYFELGDIIEINMKKIGTNLGIIR